jgi:hypothetical protein
MRLADNRGVISADGLYHVVPLARGPWERSQR